MQVEPGSGIAAGGPGVTGTQNESRRGMSSVREGCVEQGLARPVVLAAGGHAQK
jgi:hypothetical protein